MIDLPNDAYGHSVTMTTDDTTDIYLVGGSIPYSFPAGTSLEVVYLSIAKQFNLLKSQQMMQDFTGLNYSLESRLSLLSLYNDAVRSGLINRANYVAQVFTWVNAVIAYAATYVSNINAQTDPDTIVTISPNFGSLTATNPQVTAIAAVQINT